MRRDLGSIAVLVFALLASAPANACDLRLRDGTVAADLSALPEGIVEATVDCGARRLTAQFWTLAVDPAQTELGVRDGKLFDTTRTGPLTELVSARIEDHLRVTVQERSDTAALSLRPEPQPRARYRRFGTFCDDIADSDPLDCSVGEARIKARVTAEHVDDDGWLDISMHEISVYDGDSRLHVMSFTTPYSPETTDDIAQWIEALHAVSDLLRRPPVRP